MGDREGRWEKRRERERWVGKRARRRCTVQQVKIPLGFKQARWKIALLQSSADGWSLKPRKREMV